MTHGFNNGGFFNTNKRNNVIAYGSDDTKNKSIPADTNWNLIKIQNTLVSSKKWMVWMSEQVKNKFKLYSWYT